MTAFERMYENFMRAIDKILVRLTRVNLTTNIPEQWPIRH